MHRLFFLICILGGLVVSAAQAQEIPPHGWSLRYGNNSLYLTRPDLPMIQIAVVSDVRPELTQEQKFEFVKGFFAERANCPSLAKAQTHKSMAGFAAESEGVNIRCKLIAMGHWQEGGLQTALIVNEAVKENAILGGVAGGRTIADDGPVARAIHQDVVEFFTLRYQIGKNGIAYADARAQLTAEGYASLVPQAHKPRHMVRLRPGSGHDAVSSVREEESYSLLLFDKRDADAEAVAAPCSDWDPAMFEPFRHAFMLGPVDPCAPLFWRWKDSREGGQPEIREMVVDATWETSNLSRWKKVAELSVGEFYRPFDSGARFDLRVGVGRKAMEEMVAGTRPLAELESHELILLPDGRFAAGVLRAATLEGGRSQGPVTGQYHFDGHVITLVLSSGHVVHGFAGWLPYENGQGVAEEEISHRAAININGWVYSAYCEDNAAWCE